MQMRREKYQTPEQQTKASDDMVEIQKFLHTNLPYEKDNVYIDTEKIPTLSPKTQQLAPSNDYKYIDIRNYEYDPAKDNLPTEVLLNGINISNLAKRYGAATEKGKFLRGLAWKLSCVSARLGKDAVFGLVKYGAQLLLAVLPSVITFAGKHPGKVSAIIGGVYITRKIKSWFTSTPTQKELEEALDQVDKNKIVDLRDIPPPQPGPAPIPPTPMERLIMDQEERNYKEEAETDEGFRDNVRKRHGKHKSAWGVH